MGVTVSGFFGVGLAIFGDGVIGTTIALLLVANLFLGGGNSSTLFPDARNPRITFVGGELRFCRMVSNVMGSGFYRGNFEILLGAFAAGVTDGPGRLHLAARTVLRTVGLFLT